jgi:hypothetical protein
MHHSGGVVGYFGAGVEMAGCRLLKPGIFQNETLAELPHAARLLYAGLCLIADREGRLEDRPSRIRAELFPYEQALDVNAMLATLAERGFIVRYTIGVEKFIAIPKFLNHQRPHIREAQSVISAPDYGEHQPRHDLGSAEHDPRLPVSVSDPVSVSGSVSNPGSKSGAGRVQGRGGKSGRQTQLNEIAKLTFENHPHLNDDELEDHFRHYNTLTHNLSKVTREEITGACSRAYGNQRAARVN